MELKIYPKMKLNVKTQYVWRLEHKPAFRLMGKKCRISCIDNTHYSKIPELWYNCQKDGTFSKLIAMDEGRPQGIMGLCSNYDTVSDEMDYLIMVAAAGPLEEEMVELLIPDMTWAVFDCYGTPPGAIQSGWKYLKEEWLIKYPFRHADCPEIEWYSNQNIYANDYLSQIWIPIMEE